MVAIPRNRLLDLCRDPWRYWSRAEIAAMVATLKRKKGTNKLLRIGDKLAAHDDCCCDDLISATCTPCNETMLPRFYLIELSGITNGACGSCAGLNGSYVVEHRTSCTWSVDFSPVCTGHCVRSFDRINLSFGVLGVTVSIGGSVGSPPTVGVPSITWILSGTSPKKNCASFSALSIPFSSNQGCPTTAICNGSAATCLVTAL
ncbi:MAG: hypothetical protein KF708_22460 [Pirellulales bacterium]|nr:hypothetical protein [Pirellulales bacterium]